MSALDRDALDGVRVLHLFANYKWTGPADPAIRAAARLRALGLDVVFAQAGFVHPGGEHRVAEELRRARVPVVTGMALRKHFHVGALLHDVRVLRRLLRRDGYRVLHCHQPADHLTAALACRSLDRPPVLVRSLYEPEPPRFGWRERAAFRRTQAVLAPTRAARDGVAARFPFAPDALLLQEPVTEPRRLDGPDARAAFGLGAEHKVVGITARIQPHRRFELLWAVARHVVDRVPEARFVLLGRGNEQDTRQLVTEPVAKLGLGGHVVLPGYQKADAYERALRALDAFLFLVPGSDGTCRAVCDAMAFGLPVVATRRGILPELCSSPRAGEVPGFAVDETPAALGDALVKLLRDDALRRGCGEAALRRARLDMDPLRAAERTRDLYARLLAAQDGRR
ncbi:MAG: glycosyltransferase family 4 protein [Planctomycetes bacterium]|nr:glycosyltransferase family 4 protein [Planctomycetota bacterium]